MAGFSTKWIRGLIAAILDRKWMKIELGHRVSAIPGKEMSRVVFPALLFTLLAAPSVYLFCLVPPLWRDSDGFYQVATKFEFLTVLHWPPLYCFCARFPFLLAAVLDGSFFRSGFSFNWPRITDLGIYLLLVFQHLFLVGALVSVCLMLAKNWLVRFLMGAFFVTCAPIYVFAHCVGSEAIMAPLLLLGATVGLRYVWCPSRRWLILWFIFIGLNVLDRHANGVIAGLLPLTILILLGLTAIRPARRTGWRDRPGYPSVNIRSLFISILVSIAAILTANAVILVVCRVDKIPYRSRAGYAFVWRLDFIKDLPLERQTTIINKAETDLQDSAVTAALEQLKEMSARGEFNPDAVCAALDKALGEQGYQGQQRHVLLDQKLNRFFAYFLLHDPVDLFQAVARDMSMGMSFTPSLLSKDPFLCTDWLVKHLSEPRFQPIQELKTLSASSEPTEKYDSSFYCRSWAFLPFFFVTGAVLLASVFCILTAKSWRHLVLAAYAIASAATGIICAAVSSIVVALLPRLMLPTLILLWFAMVVLLLRLDSLKFAQRKDGAVATT
jgi:hypothetical protein